MKRIASYLIIFLLAAQAVNAFASSDAIGKETTKVPDWSVQIYPNPSNGICNLMVAGYPAKLDVNVFNVIGEKVFETQVSGKEKTKLDLTSLEKGLYIIQVMDKTRNEVRTMRLQLK